MLFSSRRKSIIIIYITYPICPYKLNIGITTASITTPTIKAKTTIIIGSKKLFKLVELVTDDKKYPQKKANRIVGAIRVKEKEKVKVS